MGKQINQIIRFFTTDIWRITQGDVSPVRFLMVNAVKRVMLAVRFFLDKLDILVYAVRQRQYQSYADDTY